MLTTLQSPKGPSGSARDVPSTPPAHPPRSSSASNINNLLSPTPTTTHNNGNSTPNNTNNNNNNNKRKSPYMDSSPRKARSPAKVGAPGTPEASSKPPASDSPRAPLSTSRAALNHLLNDEDRPPISNGGTNEADADADAIDADVLMHEEDEEDARPRAEEDDGERGEGDEEDGESESDDDEEEEDDDDEDDDSGDDSDGSDIIEVTGASEATKAATDGVQVKTEPDDATAAPDGAAAAAPGGAEEAADPAKKKKAKRPRRESMDEDLPPPPPPMPTIRVEVQFPTDGDTLDFNFREIAHEAGYEVINPYHNDYAEDEPATAADTAADTAIDTPANGDAPPASRGPPNLQDLMDADPLEMERLAAQYEAKYDDQKPKKRMPAKKKRVIDYDLNDPFIDDSDLKIDAPTHVARPKKEGFFVHQGHLELMEESPHRLKSRSKPKASKKEVKEPRKSLSEALREAGTSRGDHNGTSASPILIDSDNENAVPYINLKRSPSPPPDEQDNVVDRVLFKSASRDPRYLPPFNEFPDEVAHRLRALRRESIAHGWDLNNKGKFPEHLKPALQRAGEAAFHHDMLCIVDKDPTDSNYERYQEKAFVSALTSVLPYNKLTLGKLVLKLCYPVYWRWLVAREEEGLRQWKELLEPEVPAMIEAYENDVARVAAAPDEPADGTDDADGGKKKEPEQAKKIPVFTQDMKDIFRQLVENTQEEVDVNKKMEEWSQRIEGQASELNMRKFLYLRIIAMYPEGYMTSLALSRAFTNFKRSGQGAKQKEEQALAIQQ